MTSPSDKRDKRPSIEPEAIRSLAFFKSSVSEKKVLSSWFSSLEKALDIDKGEMESARGRDWKLRNLACARSFKTLCLS